MADLTKITQDDFVNWAIDRYHKDASFHAECHIMVNMAIRDLKLPSGEVGKAVIGVCLRSVAVALHYKDTKEKND